MLIELKSNLFAKKSNLQEVNQLLGLFSDRNRYDYFCEFTEILDSELFLNLPHTEREIAEQHYNRVIQESSVPNYTVSEETSETEFNILEAKRFFNQPLIIILENSLNDGFFVDSLLSVFEEEGSEIRRQKQNGWVEYGNAGGCGNIKNFIEARKSNFLFLPKKEHNYLRLYVLIDSDKRYPNDTSVSRVKLEEYLGENNVPFHILEKREIENYIPDEIIGTIVGHDEYINAYKALNPIPKDYFDVEKGFQNKNRNKLDENILNLFQDLSDKSYKALKNKMNYKNIKSEFPKLFLNATKDQLKQRTAHQENPRELEDLLAKITELI